MLAIIPGASPTRRARPADLRAEAQRCALALSRGGNRAGLVHSGQLFVSCCHADGRTEFAAGERNSAHMSVGTMFDRGRQVGGPGKAQEAAADRDGMPMDLVHVNGPWCITFEFDGENAMRVDFEQYH